MSRLFARREASEFRKRYGWMALVVVIAFLGLVARMAYLQVIQQERYVAIAKNNITRRHKLPAMRGDILDRHNNIVASNRASYRVYLTPNLLDMDRDLKRIIELLDLSAEQGQTLIKKIDDVPDRRRNQRIEIFKDVSREQLAILETHEKDFPGLDVVAMPVRTYPYRDLAAHAIGYVNEVSAEDLSTLKSKGYAPGDTVGRMGVERAWEASLRGNDGFTETTVDVQGSERNEFRVASKRTRMQEPITGNSVVLSLDMRLMHILHKLFRSHPAGAAVVVDVTTGELRALYSKPAYDLNEMAGRLTAERASELDRNLLRPRIDKTLYETYYPGSTLKPIFALAGLEAGTVTERTQVYCPGYIEFGRDRKRCTRVHGNVDLQSALVQSCNVYFYRLGEGLGLDLLADYGSRFGLGQKTGVGINTEAQGFIPTKNWYVSHYKTPFRVGYTLNEVIGQGNTRVTLMQLAMAYAALANGGVLYRPLLVKEVRGPKGNIKRTFAPEIKRKIEISPEYLAAVMRGMRGVIMDPNGTAYDVRVPDGIDMAGKTGTAQVSRKYDADASAATIALGLDRDHAWFAGIAPLPTPRLAIVVLVEHGGGGGKYAAPIGIGALQEYLSTEPSS
ncbi:MAG: penicillin-binding protein 2 [Myxococcales bacterium]|nr:penicillin-binding protein 2 [Myxococcales bacterium]MCB9709514.1 penicillin-binding protein 2 [Myxococcales bacterium]